MKKIISVMLISVMFLSCSPAFSEYRTGSATGDSVAYGVGAGIIAAVAATVVTVCTGGLALPVVAVAGGAGLVGGGIYGAVDDNKTLTKDITAGAMAVAGGVVIAKHDVLKTDVLKTKEFQQRALIFGTNHIDDVNNLMKIEEKVFRTKPVNTNNVLEKSKKSKFSDRLKNANNQDYSNWNF